jgi:hypothetical protein
MVYVPLLCRSICFHMRETLKMYISAINHIAISQEVVSQNVRRILYWEMFEETLAIAFILQIHLVKANYLFQLDNSV